MLVLVILQWKTSLMAFKQKSSFLLRLHVRHVLSGLSITSSDGDTGGQRNDCTKSCDWLKPREFP